MKIFQIFRSNSPYIIQGWQLINLTLLLVLGKFALDLFIPWSYIFGIVISAIIIDHAFIYLRDKKLRFFSVSSVLTALGLSFMIYSESFWIYPLLLLLAFGQKYFLKVKDLHIFNPSNLAVTLGLLLFPTLTYPVLGQWGDSLYLAGFLILLGAAITYKVGRHFLPIIFFATYIPLQYLFILPLDQTLTAENLVYKITSGAFIIFAFFMLTDPRATPSKLPAQAVFITAVAAVSTAFDYFYTFSAANLFFSLTLISALNPFFLTRKACTENKKSIFVSISLFIILLTAMMFYLQNPQTHLLA